MRFLFSLICLTGFSHAHTTFTNFFINGAPQGDGTCVRMSQTPQNATSPLPDIKAPEMACGVNGDIGVARVCNAPAGAVITFEFRERPDGKEPGAIDKSHKGPIAVYMKKVEDPTANGTAAGDGWFKIFQADFDQSTQKWATETLIANQGRLSVNIPQSLAGGYYLVRTELLALHEADKTPADPQFYVGCAQIFLQGSGSAEPPNKVTIPGYIDLQKNKAALTFNIYKKPMALPYPMFGPPVFTGASTNQKSIIKQKAATKSTEQTLGLKPDDCVLANANWCGRELAAYTTQEGCWNASTACWAQCKDCYSSAPPTGSANCKIWEDKCKGIQNQCNSNSKNVNGPPNHMKDLTPKNKKVEVPAAAYGQADAAPASASRSATPSASRLFTLQQPTASASGSGNADETTTTAYRTTFKTIVKSTSSGSFSGGGGESNSKGADPTTTIHQTSFETVVQTVPSDGSVAASSSTSSSVSVSVSASASASANPSAAAVVVAAPPAPQPQANVGPDAFGSTDMCGARNASAHCGGGLCCSQFGYCGGTSQHCGIGCQDTFGACDQLPANITATTVTTSPAAATGEEAEGTKCTKSDAASSTAPTAAAPSADSASDSDSGAGAAAPSVVVAGAAADGNGDAAATTATSSSSPAAVAAAAAAAATTASTDPPSSGDGAGAPADSDPPLPAVDQPVPDPAPAPAPAPDPAAASSSSAPPLPPPPPASASAPSSAPAPAPAPPAAKPTSDVTVVVLSVDHPPRKDDV